MGTLEIIKPGLLTTVQDSGRYAHQKSGVSVSGVMDPLAHIIANILCGNDDLNEAVLELTMTGPSILFHDDAFISITGADFAPEIDGVAVETWKSYKIKKGSTLSFQGRKSGMRAYIGIFGGMDIPLVMGSKSTYLKAKIGGYEGRQLKIGDKIHYFQTDVVNKKSVQLPSSVNFLVDESTQSGKIELPSSDKETILRVVLGPQDDAFTSEGIETFLSSPYTVSNEADRMGYRLEGKAIQHKGKSDIISDGMLMGGIQVPGQGKPIILMADRQTTGGYTKIACVIYADLYKVAQAKTGDVFRFQAISVEEAQDIYRVWSSEFGIHNSEIRTPNSELNLDVSINEKQYSIAIQTVIDPKIPQGQKNYDVSVNGEHFFVSVRSLNN